MIRAIALATLATMTLAGCALTETERYTYTCRDRGGFVSAETENWHTTYNCVGQTVGPDLPELKR